MPLPGNPSTPVPFPQPEGLDDNDAADPTSTPDSPSNARRPRTSTNTSTASRIRTASIKLMEANPPPGMWAATGTSASKAPSLADIRRGSYGSDGWNEHHQRHRATSRASQEGKSRAVVTPLEGGLEPFPAVTEERTREHALNGDVQHPPVDSNGHAKSTETTIELRQSTSTPDKPPKSDTAARQTGPSQASDSLIIQLGDSSNKHHSTQMATCHHPNSLGNDRS